MTNTLPDRATPETAAPRVVVAGHLCLDIIPGLPADPGHRALRPGSLDMIGPATLSVGGCVGNTGIALNRLGLPATLVARVGDGALGGVLEGIVRAAVPEGAARLLRIAGAPASYSIVLNRPGQDRAIGHFPGVNSTFVADDVPPELLVDAALLHIGYPPLLASLVADEGRELERLLLAAHRSGAATSLDMANANLGRAAGDIRWRALLARWLPSVDVFLPSLAEACRLLGRRVQRDGQGVATLASVARLADEMLDFGVAIAGVKLGEHGLYVRSAAPDRIMAIPRSPWPAWAGRELYSPVFEADVVGTAGAGDASIAGFLFGLLTGMSPEDAMIAACAAGAASTEAADGTSGVPAWPEIERRLSGGWRRRPARLGTAWRQAASDGPWLGPRESQR